MSRRTASTLTQEALGLQAVGAGYLLRSDGVAVALLELTPPDADLLAAEALAQLLAAYTRMLAAATDRLHLLTVTVPPDPRHLLARWAQARAAAPDYPSFTILDGMYDLLQIASQAATVPPVVRWIAAYPSLAPERPPRGTWGELHRREIVGPRVRRQEPAAAIAQALQAAQRGLGMWQALGLEPAPRLLGADAIVQLLALTLDPVRTLSRPVPITAGAATLLQVRDPDDLDRAAEATPRVAPPQRGLPTPA